LIQDLNTLLLMVVAASSILFALLFIPALIEWRRPRDAGPRLVADSNILCSGDIFENLDSDSGDKLNQISEETS
jgi:hypothetical protein